MYTTERGAHQNSMYVFQDHIELFTPTNGCVVDLTCFTGSSIMATRACDRQHLRVKMTCLSIYWTTFGKSFERGSSKENIQDLTKKDDDLSDENMLEFECE